MIYPKEGFMTLLFSHGLMNANIFGTMCVCIYIYIYWHEVYGIICL